MANGDITTIKEQGRYSIPGGGRNLAGAPQNNKVLVWGTIEGTYDGTVGLDLGPRGGLRALGVSTADFFTFEVKQAGVTGTRTNPASLAQFEAGYEGVFGGGNVDSIFVVDQVGAANVAEPSDGDLITINFLVCGDDASAPILT